MNLTLDERTKIFDKVCHLVQKKHFDPGMNGVDWNALAQNRREQILACSDPAAFEKEVHKLVAELKSKYPPAEPGALGCEPLKAAERGR